MAGSAWNYNRAATLYLAPQLGGRPHNGSVTCSNRKNNRRKCSGTPFGRVLISAMHSDWLPAKVAGSEKIREVNYCASF